ncbi:MULTISPECIES: hypothetical protein [unclassified Sphingomonas]|uniref:hypothetical protein n=1 Tax=unclassified Sphingomonas TaxID=196159 RepID=UPI002269FF1C|nr:MULTISPECIES: hypothetical protein [unclassified Sphingomonas]
MLLQAGAADSYTPADRTDIPAAFRGHWALDAKYCSEPGPASVHIGARQINFYERHGFLDLAQLNWASDPPGFYGTFRWTELLHFSSGVVRLEIDAGKLFITEAADPDAPTNKVGWLKCTQ